MAYIPLIVHGKFFKRISKEEIQGWNSGHPSQPFQKQNITNKIAQSKLRRIVPKQIPEKLETLECVNTLSSIKVNNN